MNLIWSLCIFLVAVALEISGCYFIWLCLKEYKPWWYAIIGALLLAGYGVAATFQPADFGRVYAAYGGIFIVASLLWAYKTEHLKPDLYDFIGVIVTLAGVYIIYFSPRN